MAAPSEYIKATDKSYTYGLAVTASDATTYEPTSALYIGGTGSGALTVTMAGDGAQVAFAGLTAGTLLPLRVTQVRSTGTSVTSIVALW